MKNATIRLLTGIVYVGMISFCVMQSPYTFLALFMLAVFLCLREFYCLMNTHKGIKINSFTHGLGGAILFLAFFLYASGITGPFVFSFYLAYIASSLIYELYAKQKDPVIHLASVFFGQCYIALPFSVLNLLVFQTSAENISVYNWLWVFALLIFIWANDTGAYIVGSRFGKRRLWERISPKKSWEGFFGGFVFTLASTAVFAYFNPETAWYHWIGLSVGVVVFGTWGDLIESLIKRTLNVKDSGCSLPGHGGFLDRFDSLLLAVYAMYFYTQLFL
jgi:phosphatidate cytidylyltransferase